MAGVPSRREDLGKRGRIRPASCHPSECHSQRRTFSLSNGGPHCSSSSFRYRASRQPCWTHRLARLAATAIPDRVVALSLLSIDKDSSIEHLAGILRRRASALSPGDPLPSTRVLVAEHHVSPVTVSRAIAMLVAEGLVVTRPGAGTFVTGGQPAVTATPPNTDWQAVPLADRTVDTGRLAFMLRPTTEGVISLASGYPHPALLPARALSAAVTRAARRADTWEQPSTSGLRGLRLWFARSVGGVAEPDHVLVTTGGQASLSTAFRAMLPPGAPILVESPTYLGALAVAKSAGLRPVPVPVDAGGIDLDYLADAFKASGARALYLQAAFQNPTGACLADDRRDALLELCAHAGAFVIEDDYARWLAHEKPAPAPLAARDRDGRVVLITSLTKVTSSSFRVGALIARGPVFERLCSLRLVDDFFVSRLLQEAALDLVSSPGWSRHLASLSAALAVRRDALARALAVHIPELQVLTIPKGGTSLWVRLPDGVDDAVVADRAGAVGVLVTPGRPFYAAEPAGAYMRLSFAGSAQVGELEEAVQRLALAVRTE